MFKIETIKLNDDTDPDQVVHELIANQKGNFKRIGHGSFGYVYGSKTDGSLVYKVGDVLDNGPYLAYVKTLANEKVHNPFTPKIYGVRIYKNRHESVFIVAMERLQDLPAKSWAHQWFKSMLTGEGEIHATYELGVKMAIPSQLKNALKLLEKAKSKCRFADWDLRECNFMMRGNQVVVTDPPCSNSLFYWCLDI